MTALLGRPPKEAPPGVTDWSTAPTPARPRGVDALGGKRGHRRRRASAAGVRRRERGRRRGDDPPGRPGRGDRRRRGLGIVALRLIRRETSRQALGSLAGLAVAVVFAARSGEARGFFLPGIYVDAAYAAVVFAGSALIGRPLAGTATARSSGSGSGGPTRAWAGCSSSPPSVRSAVFAVRAGVQAFLYREDLPGLLAAGKLVLGWPLTLLAAVLTLAAVRRVSRRTARETRSVAAG